MKKQIISVLFVIAVIAGTSAVFHATQSFYKQSVRGMRLFNEGDYILARPYLEKAIALKPEKKEILTALLETYDKLGLAEEKQTILKKGLEQFPKNKTYLREMGDVSYQLGDYAAAEQAYRALQAQKETRYTRRKLSEVLAWQKKNTEAAKVLEKILEDDPTDIISRKLLADVYMWSKQYDKAAEAYRKVLEQDSENRDVALKLAEALRFGGRNDEAIKVYEKYLNDDK